MKWDRRFLDVAETVSTWSKDPSTKVGAVIVDAKRRILGTGYNGFPRGIEDSPDRYADREHKYAHVVHAEMNAILNATRDLDGCALYLWQLPPCSHCAKHIIQSGIARVIARAGARPHRWADDFSVSIRMLREAGITYSEVEVVDF